MVIVLTKYCDHDRSSQKKNGFYILGTFWWKYLWSIRSIHVNQNKTTIIGKQVGG